MGVRHENTLCVSDKIRLCSLDSFLDIRFPIESVLSGFNVCKIWSCLRVLWCENCTAILIRQDRGIKSIYLSCYLHYLRFVHTNAWSENRHTASGVCADHCIHSLARYLTKALACNKGLDILFLAYPLCYLHHKSSHKE